MCATDHVPVAGGVIEDEPVFLFGLEQFLEASHVLVTPSGMDAAVVNHFSDALRVVAGSDLLTCVPNGFMNGPGGALAAQHGLICCEIPFETEKLIYKLIWHERLDTHPAHQWFRSLVADVCQAGTLPHAAE